MVLPRPDSRACGCERSSVERSGGDAQGCVALWVAWYNFGRVNTAIRMTPCMAAGVTYTIWTMRDLLTA